MDSLTRAQLDDLKEDLKELFDENGNRYSATRISVENAERMYRMILSLEKECESLSDQIYQK
jgi:hypothetical protein